MKIVKYFLISALFIALGVIYSREMPKLKKFLIRQVHSQAMSRASLDVNIQEIEFKIFPPAIALNQIEIKPLGPAAEIVSPSTIDSLEVRLGLASFLVGRFEIGEILLKKPRASIFIKASEAESQPLKIPFAELLAAPMSMLTLDKADIRLKFQDQGIAAQLSQFNFRISRSFQSIKIDVLAPDILVKRLGVNKSLTQYSLAMRALVKQSALEISAFKVSHQDSFLIGKALAQGDIENFKWSTLNSRVAGSIHLEQAITSTRVMSPELKLPSGRGSINFELGLSKKRSGQPLGMLTLETKDLKIEEFFIGNILGQLYGSDKIVKTKVLKINQDSGHLRLENAEFNLTPPYGFGGRIQIEGIELRKLLNNLDVTDVPLHLDFKGKIPCEGALLPKFGARCAGEIQGSNFRVWTNPENKTVVALDQFNLLGTLEIDKSKISFPKALLTIGSSSGSVKGEVDFEKGFSFSYKTPKLDFKDIKSLADLRYEGSAALEGTTFGDSDFGVIDTKTVFTDFWFEDYWLGSGQMQTHYEKGLLSFENLSAQLDESIVEGRVQIKLPGTSQIQAKVKMPRVDLRSVAKAFSRKTQLPFTVQGLGIADLSVSGPLVFSSLDYVLNSHFRNVQIFDEFLKEVQFNVAAQRGNVKADDVAIKKGDGLIQLVGEVDSNGMMNLQTQARGLRISDFEHARNLASSLEGRVVADLQLRDYILKPQVSLSGRITEATLGQEPIEDSDFRIQFGSQGMHLQSDLFNNKVNFSFSYPFGPGLPSALKFKSTNWDFSKLLGIVGKNPRRDYETNLTASIDVSNSKGSLWDGRGMAEIKDLYVRRGNSHLRTRNPIKMKFDDGTVTLASTEIEGDQTQLTISGGRSKSDLLNFTANGKIDLSLASFLTPFLKDMSGELSLSTQIAGSSQKPDILGSAFIKNGYFKIEEIPHPLENVEADILFSQSKAIVNRLVGNFASGRFALTGNAMFKGWADVPVDISGEVHSINLMIPEGLNTKGHLNLNFSGNWFPYLMKGTYDVESGLYSKNFDDDSGVGGVKRSSFLPQVILQKDFYPLDLNLTVNLNKGLQVKNTLMDAEVRGSVLVKGNPQFAVLLGELEAIPNGKIFFRENAFNISAARARFANPNQINPQLYAMASTRVRDWDVNMLVQGNLDKYKIELTSSPPLSEPKIVSLLALGLTDDALDTQTSDSQLALQGYQAAGIALATNPLQTELKKRLGVNVRLSQSVDATKNVVTPRVVAEKQWTPQLSTSFGRTIGDQVTQDVNIQYKLNRNFSILGSYEGRDYDPLSTTTSNTTGSTQPQSSGTQDIFGVGLEFQREYR
ncbi:MAG: translocation/assembly module TamB domain-containing protein [Oligoflexia bacterium]|nr:translocation/assembly module TamB domain-containing protein [Oligoflexia bacterium]